MNLWLDNGYLRLKITFPAECWRGKFRIESLLGYRLKWWMEGISTHANRPNDFRSPIDPRSPAFTIKTLESNDLRQKHFYWRWTTDSACVGGRNGLGLDPCVQASLYLYKLWRRQSPRWYIPGIIRMRSVEILYKWMVHVWVFEYSEEEVNTQGVLKYFRNNSSQTQRKCQDCTVYFQLPQNIIPSHW